MSAAEYYPTEPRPPPVVTTSMFPMHPVSHEYDQLRPQASGASLKNEASFNRRGLRSLQTLKRVLRILRVVSRILSSIFSAIMLAIMAFVYLKFLSTRNMNVGGRGPWPAHPKVWPTLMLLIGALLTLGLSILGLMAYCCCFSKAWHSWKLTILKYVIHILVWAIISSLYRYEKSLHGVINDLWGWSCSQEAAALQSSFKTSIDFQSLCTIQASSWYFSMVEVILKILFAIAHLLIYRSTRTKKKLAESVGEGAADLLQNVY